MCMSLFHPISVLYIYIYVVVSLGISVIYMCVWWLSHVMQYLSGHTLHLDYFFSVFAVGVVFRHVLY